MSLKEDCFNFRFVEKDNSGLGDRAKRTMSIPNCIINKMPMGGCPEKCEYYES